MKPLRIASAAVLALALTACTIPTPVVPTKAPVLEHSSALYESQSTRIVDQTLAEIAAADEAGDAALLDTRVSGDAKRVRKAEYKVKSKGGDKPTIVPEVMQAIYATDQESFPRIMASVSDIPAADLTPLVMLWVQDDVTTDYQLRYWSHMLPGAVLPAMPGQADGATQIPLDQAGYTMTPAAAIELYATILTEGTKGENDAAFAPDAYRERMFAARDALNKTAKKRKGSYKDVITARIDEAFALQSDEGGALVFVPISVVSTFKVPGAQLKLPTKDKALLSGKLKDKVLHYYSDFIVISIPPAGSAALPSVVAADHHLLDVTIKAAKDES